MVMKRYAAPKFWPIEKKTKKYVIDPSPGPHAKKMCLPLGVILRDVLKYAETLEEVKEILNNCIVKIDKRVRKDHKFPVGLMDIITIGDDSYRVLPNKHGFYLQKTNSGNIKLLRVENKKYVGKKVQLNLHDGKNILIDKNNYKTGDTLLFDLDKGSFDSMSMGKGATALVVFGRNVGRVGKIEEITVMEGSKITQITINSDGVMLIIPKNYVFVIGENKPVIELGE
ncbi:MAG: 30S ribosomal protein S4e [Candidatus Aenigmatarchaeota archaeon]